MQCFICERSIRIDEYIVDDATIWHTEGNYGSHVYDPTTGSAHLEIIICDACLTSRAHLVDQVTTQTTVKETMRRPTQTIEDWTQIYDGLTDEQMERIDQIAKKRANLTRSS